MILLRRRFVHALSLCLVVVGFGVGCGGSSKNRPDEPKDKPLAAEPLTFDQSLAALPADINAVIGADLAKVRTSAYYDKLARPMVQQILGNSVLLAHPCIDLAEGAQTLLFAIGDDPNDPQKTFAIASLSKSRDEIHACLAKPPEGAAAVAVDADGPSARYTVGSEVVTARWLSQRTIVVSRPEALGRLGDGHGEAGNPALVELLGKADRSAMFWGASADVQRFGTSSPFPLPIQRPRAAYGSCDAPGKVALHLGLVFDSETNATAMKQELDSQLAQARSQPLVGGYLSDTHVAQSGPNVDLRVGLTESDVKSLLALLEMAGGSLPLPGQ